VRKTKDVMIGADGGRDGGKVFVITEMPSWQAEEWATRALIAMAKGGAQISEDVLSSGFAGIAFLGIQSLPAVNYADIQPLMREMFRCIQIRPNPSVAFTRALVDDGTGDDIEEVKTRIILRKEVLNLHMDFSKAAAGSKSTAETTAAPTSKTAPTSRERSAKPSRLVRHRP
jgi:hypothetical protein